MWRRSLILGIGAAAVVCATTVAVARHGSSEIARLVKQLGHPRYELREDAEKVLVRIGMPAAAGLRDAMDHPLPEIRHRVRRALRGITRLTPQQQGVKRKEAQSAFRAGDFESMLQRYAHLAMGDTVVYQDLLWLGHAHQLLNDWPGAVSAYDRALHTLDRRHQKDLNRRLDAERQRQIKDAEVHGQHPAVAQVLALRRRKAMQQQFRAQNAHHVRTLATYRLLIGRIQRDVLKDLPAAARSFVDGVRDLKGANEQIPDLISELIERDASPNPLPPQSQLLYPLTVMRELAETHLQLGRIDDAIDAWNRHNLIGLFNAARPNLEIHAIARLARQRDAAVPMPPLAAVEVMSDRNARVVYDLDNPATRGRAYQVIASAGSRSWRFALMPDTGLEFDTVQIECEFERKEPNVDGRVRCWGVGGPQGNRHVQIGEVDWPPGAGDGRRNHDVRYEFPSGIDMMHLESVQGDEAFNVHRIEVNATFRPRVEPAEPGDIWARVEIETLPADGLLQRNGAHVVHGGVMPLKPGEYDFHYAVPGHREVLRTQLTLEAGRTYGLLINLDSPFRSRLTDLRGFGTSYSADPNLVRLADGRWLVVFCRDYENIMISTSDDGIRWDEPWPLPFNDVCKTVAPSLFVDVDGSIWLTYFSNRLHLEPVGTAGYRLWLTRTEDGREWSRPRPIEFGGFGGWPAGSARITRHPDGRYWMFWRDYAGSASSLDELTDLTSLAMGRKHKLAVGSPHVTIAPDGVFHMVFTNHHRDIRYCRSSEGRKWTEPLKLVEDRRTVGDAQLFLDDGRVALVYETRAGMFLCRGTLKDAPVLGDPVKISRRATSLFGFKAHLTPDGDMLILAGQDTVWLMRARMQDVLGRRE